MACKTFTTFPVEKTTIFPLANSSRGGQLLTERNQLLGPSVANHSVIKYICPPSYTHSVDDFKIEAAGGSRIKISGGSAIVHGHFVNVDANASMEVVVPNDLTGNLAIGLIAIYSGESTAAAAMLVEDANAHFYLGVQVVIGPVSEMKTPEMSKDDPAGVTVHLLLGTFTHQRGTIRNLQVNPDKYKVLDSDRIANLDALLKGKYVTNEGLNPHKLYVMAGKGEADPTDRSYWSDATPGMMVWDASSTPRLKTDEVPEIVRNSEGDGKEFLTQAEFRYDPLVDSLKLVVPHKEIPNMKDANDKPLVYWPREIEVPAANRATGAGGVLDSSWVNFLNGLDNKIATMYRMPGGKMRKFIDVLTDRADLPQPPIAYYTEQTRESAYYDTRLQYSFNLLQSQLAQLNNKFLEFQSSLETNWKTAITDDLSAQFESRNQINSEAIAAARADIANLQSSLSGFQGDVASASGSITSVGDSLQSQLDTLAEQLTILQNRWVGNTDAGSSGSSSDDVDKRLDELQKMITAMNVTLATTLATVNRAKTDAMSIAESSATNLSTLYDKLYGFNKDGSNGDIKDLNTAIEQLRSQYDYLYDAIHDLYDSIEAEVQSATSTLRSDLLTDLRSQIQALVAQFADEYNLTTNWAPGDYVIVAQDQTVSSEATSEQLTFPSTMYVVVPGRVPLDSKYIASYYDVYFTDLSTPINRVFAKGSGTSSKDTYSDALDTYAEAVATLKRQVPARFAYGYELGSNDVQDLASENELPDVYNSSVMVEALTSSSVMLQGVRGTPGKDYFVLRYRYPIGSPATGYTDEYSGKTFDNVQYQVYRWVSVFFTLNLTNDKLELDTDNPIMLSGGTPYAEEERIGGFLNVGPEVYGGGYIHRDEAGHLRLNDFELLAAGVSAYQLGEDRSEGAGLNLEELQGIFDQYVNQRVAFPNENQLYRAAALQRPSDVIRIDLQLGSTTEGELNIYDLDSRFQTAVEFNITGAATENTVLRFRNCSRIRIIMDQICNPTIILDNVGLYYDADIIDRIASISGLSLWYKRYSSTDPNLEVDGMTVIYQDRLEPKGTKEFWTRASANDNSYGYALRQLTFASDGTIIGAGLAVTDNTTSNISPNSNSIFASTFSLPQTVGLSYPVTKLTKQIKVTGNFVTAYATKDTSGTLSGYNVKNTNFTALTQKYLRHNTVNKFIQGVISFYTSTIFIEDTEGVDAGSLIALGNEYAIDGWEPGAYHIFYGGAVE